MAYHGTTCMFVGFNTDSGSDVYLMWNPKTNRVPHTRDILWLNKIYFKPQAREYHKADNSIIDSGDAEEHKIMLQILEVMKKTSEEMIWKLVKKKLNPLKIQMQPGQLGQYGWLTSQTCMTNNVGSLMQKLHTKICYFLQSIMRQRQGKYPWITCRLRSLHV